MTLRRLLDAGHGVTGFFFNPNIHPLSEYLRRREGAAQVCRRLEVPLLFADALPRQEQDWGQVAANLSAPLEGGVPSGKDSLPFAESRTPPCPDLPPAADPRPWLRLMAGREAQRCPLCWRIRLAETVRIARNRGFEAFSSSLLYSRRQDHQGIRLAAESLAASSGLAFVYQDFRASWQEGIDLSKAWGVYRQNYCGCLYSEYDRYARAGAQAWGG
jgi:predicted adenine nucleotide alpha hydrolase (AANH) superfamily ATPase